MRRSRALPLRTVFVLALSAALSVAGSAPAVSQGVKLAVGDVGLGIGPVPRLDGLRINFRDDDRLVRVRGVNITVWSPEDEIRGDVSGLALGLPLTGADDLTGVAVAGGVAVMGEFTGIGLAPIGMGSGDGLSGIVLAGIGAGTGGPVRGLMAGGLGVGAGGDAEGILIGGLGAGVGNRLTGVAIGGLGVGSGDTFEGLGIAGLGLGAGGDFTGVGLAGLGIGAGNDVSGVTIAGAGIGAGSHLRWVAIAGLGVGAPRITGFATALGVGGSEIEGFIVAPAYFRLVEGGRLTGVTISAFNDVRGSQHGLSIGLVNIAEELHGLQLGLINIARNKDRLKVLPLFNYHP